MLRVMQMLLAQAVWKTNNEAISLSAIQAQCTVDSSESDLLTQELVNLFADDGSGPLGIHAFCNAYKERNNARYGLGSVPRIVPKWPPF